jgi:hypothetical protein
MTDPAPVHEEVDEDLLPDVCTEISTGILFEVRFFDGFCIVRPATPSFYCAIKKISYSEFSEKFTEFLGDREQVREFLRGMMPDFIVRPR